MTLKLDEVKRRLENEFYMREKTNEDRTRELLRQTNERFSMEDDLRKRETEELLSRKLREEKQTIESEFIDQKTRLERQIAVERNHER